MYANALPCTPLVHAMSTETTPITVSHITKRGSTPFFPNINSLLSPKEEQEQLVLLIRDWLLYRIACEPKQSHSFASLTSNVLRSTTFRTPDTTAERTLTFFAIMPQPRRVNPSSRPLAPAIRSLPVRDLSPNAPLSTTLPASSVSPSLAPRRIINKNKPGGFSMHPLMTATDPATPNSNFVVHPNHPAQAIFEAEQRAMQAKTQDYLAKESLQQMQTSFGLVLFNAKDIPAPLRISLLRKHGCIEMADFLQSQQQGQ